MIVSITIWSGNIDLLPYLTLSSTSSLRQILVSRIWLSKLTNHRNLRLEVLQCEIFYSSPSHTNSLCFISGHLFKVETFSCLKLRESCNGATHGCF